MSYGRRNYMSDSSRIEPGSGKRNVDQGGEREPNCLGCGMITQLEKRQTKTEEHSARTDSEVATLSSRISSAELNAARLAGVVEGLPDLIDAKFNSLIFALKTRDEIERNMRMGHDIENTSPPPSRGQAEVRAKDYRLRLSQWVLVLAIIVGSVTYTVVRIAESWGPPTKPPAIIGH